MLLIIASIASNAVAAQPLFSVKVFENSIYTDEAEKQGNKVQIYPEICNFGTDGTMRVECGIYTEKQVKSWGYTANFFSFLNAGTQITNCVAAETNVDTRSLTLDNGECVSPKADLNPFGKPPILFNPIAPSSDPNDEYVILCQAFTQCYAPDVDPGISDYDIVSFDLKDKGLTAETCADGITNQDETSTDCGGSCEGCELYDFCNTKSDCQNGLICTSGRCAKVITEEPTCGNGACETGEDAKSCKSDCGIANNEKDPLGPVTIVAIKAASGIIGLIFAVMFLIAGFKTEKEGSSKIIFLILGTAFLLAGIFFLLAIAGKFATISIIVGAAAFFAASLISDEYAYLAKYLNIIGLVAILLGAIVGGFHINKLLDTFSQPSSLSLWQKIWR